MWPIVLTQLNLPRKIRYKFANLLLVGIIPSQVQGKEPKDLDPFLEELVDKVLFLSSCQLYDTYRKAPFQAKVNYDLHPLFSRSGESVLPNRDWFIERLWMVYAKEAVLQAFRQSALSWQQAFPVFWSPTAKRLLQFPEH